MARQAERTSSVYISPKTRKVLERMALKLGYRRGGEGSLPRMLEAIERGDVALVDARKKDGTP